MHHARRALAPLLLGLCAATGTAQTTPVVAAETSRAGMPANPAMFLPGLTSGPVIGATWDPAIDHTTFMPAATLDAIALSAAPANISFGPPLGTLLGDFASPTLFVSGPASARFAIPFPNDARLTGLTLCSQGLSVDATRVRLTNALDLTIGDLQPLYTEIATTLDGMLRAAVPPATSLAIYSSQDFATQTFVRNPSCWAASLDLTGISPWNQAHAQLRAGTLISPRHIAFARHYPLSTTPGNNQIAFVTDQDVTVIRQVVGVAYPAADIGIGVLDADVPPSIAFYKVLPRDWNTYFLRSRGLPMLHLDQEEKALVRDMQQLTTRSANCWHTLPTDPLRRAFAEDVIGGDSGNPAFLLIGGEPILMLTHHTTAYGPFYGRYHDEVNMAMTQLGGGYQLTELDLSARTP